MAKHTTPKTQPAGGAVEKSIPERTPMPAIAPWAKIGEGSIEGSIPDSRENIPAQLRQSRAALLRDFARMAKVTLDDFLEEEDNASFQHLLAYAAKHGIINDRSLAEMGRAGQTTANRWINGKSVPSAGARETILRKLVEDARLRADRLEKFGSEEDGRQRPSDLDKASQ